MQEVKYHLYIIIKKGVGVTLYLSYIAILKFPNCKIVIFMVRYRLNN